MFRQYTTIENGQHHSIICLSSLIHKPQLLRMTANYSLQKRFFKKYSEQGTEFHKLTLKVKNAAPQEDWVALQCYAFSALPSMPQFLLTITDTSPSETFEEVPFTSCTCYVLINIWNAVKRYIVQSKASTFSAFFGSIQFLVALYSTGGNMKTNARALTKWLDNGVLQHRQEFSVMCSVTVSCPQLMHTL